MLRKRFCPKNYDTYTRFLFTGVFDTENFEFFSV